MASRKLLALTLLWPSLTHLHHLTYAVVSGQNLFKLLLHSNPSPYI